VGNGPSARLIGAAIGGPGLIGGIGIILGLPALLLLLLIAGAAGFVVAHPGRGRPRLSAYAGLGASAVALFVVAAPFVPTLLGDAEFRTTALTLVTVIGPVVVVSLGLGAVIGYGGGWVGRDVARRSAVH
jgi:hypothetical protein